MNVDGRRQKREKEKLPSCYFLPLSKIGLLHVHDQLKTLDLDESEGQQKKLVREIKLYDYHRAMREMFLATKKKVEARDVNEKC